jgi:hypothetical protein
MANQISEVAERHSQGVTAIAIAINNHSPVRNIPLSHTSEMISWKPLQLGRMDVSCSSCQGLHWMDERSPQSTQAAPKFETCCKKGDVQLESLPDPPDILKRLLSTPDADGKHFRKHLREYNSALSFTSLKYSVDERISILGPGIQCFQIHGELYHRQGPLNPQQNHQPQFAQLFLYDPHLAADIRQRDHMNLQSGILHALTNMLHDVNPFINIYKMAKERLDQQANLQPGQEARILLNPQLQLILEVGSDHRRYISKKFQSGSVPMMPLMHRTSKMQTRN